jgi:predicted kinase
MAAPTAKTPARPRLVLITGIMAAGKSTVAQHLAERLSRSVHLRGDVFRKMIVGGRAPMTLELSPEAAAQLHLRYDIAAAVAAMYLDAGFDVVYQDIILGADLLDVARSLGRHELYVVVLCPAPGVVAAREEARAKTGYGDMQVAAFDDVLRTQTPRLGLWLDTSRLTVAETVDRILERLHEARIEVT